MPTPKQATVKAALHEYAEAQASKLRGSAGTSAVYSAVMAHLPQMTTCADFVMKCRVLSASVALHAGDVPIVRVKLRSGRRTRTVTPSRWLQDLVGGFGAVQYEDFARELRKVIPAERLAELEADIANAKAVALTDQSIMDGVHGKLARKRAAERDRLLKVVAQTFKGLPHDLLTEDDVVRLWRENQVRHVLES